MSDKRINNHCSHCGQRFAPDVGTNIIKDGIAKYKYKDRYYDLGLAYLKNDGNMRKTAREQGINHMSLKYIIKKLGIPVNSSPRPADDYDKINLFKNEMKKVLEELINGES